MNTFRIVTDSACDLSPAVLKAWDIACVRLRFYFADKEEESFFDGALSPGEFYAAMRQGRTVRTSGVNAADFEAIFRQELDAGRDVLYIGFSSALSSTFAVGRQVAAELAAKYPDRQLLCVDSLCASAGTGLLLLLTARQRDAGCTVDEAASFAQATAPRICHWFTVDDLTWLKRGGRISPTLAFVGSALGFKPVMHMDDTGHLVSQSRVRGRRAALQALCDAFDERAKPAEGAIILLSHADCEADARQLAALLTERRHVHVELIADVGPVIGAHCGPGTLALFFVGEPR